MHNYQAFTLNNYRALLAAILNTVVSSDPLCIARFYTNNHIDLQLCITNIKIRNRTVTLPLDHAT